MSSEDTSAETPPVAPAATEEGTAPAEGGVQPGDGGDGPKIEGDALFTAVDVSTGEENEDTKWKRRAKLFRFDKETNSWKERGTGDIKFLEDKDTKRVRLLMRRDGTLKICCNHLVTASLELKPNVGSERSWVWSVAGDMADDAPSDEVFAIRFQTVEVANEFKEQFEACQKAIPA